MSRFAKSSLQSAAVAAAALAFASLAPLSADGRAAAVLGAAVSGACGIIALALKARAVTRPGLPAALRAVGITFALRMVVAAQGVMVIARSHGAPLYFVAAFFAVYAVQQVIEASWVTHPEGAAT